MQDGYFKLYGAAEGQATVTLSATAGENYEAPIPATIPVTVVYKPIIPDPEPAPTPSNVGGSAQTGDSTNLFIICGLTI